MLEHHRVLGARRAPVLLVAKRCAWTLSAVLLLATRREAHAQSAPEPEVFYAPPRVRVFADLTYERAPDAAACPDERTFRKRVRARMGFDSFTKNPRGAYAGRVRVEVSRAPGGFTASYTWIDAEGATKTERFTANGASELHCFYALDEAAMGLAGHLAMLEASLGAKLARRGAKKSCPPAEPCPPPVESNYSVWPKEPPMPAPQEKPKLPDRWPLAVRLGAAVWPEIITSRGALGFSVEAGVRYRFFSISAELHGDPPLDAVLHHTIGKVTFARVSGALLLCGHYGWFVGCGVLDAGRILFPNHVALLPASTHYGAAGVRAGLEFPVAPPRFFLRATLDLRAPILVKSYVQDDTAVFQAAGLGVGVGLGFVAELGP